jgi:DNA repair protein RadC
LSLGPEPLADVELVAVLLGTGGRGHSALDLAHDLLTEYGGAGGLAGALPAELARRTGLGPVKAARLVAAFNLARRVGAPVQRVQLRDTADIADVVRPWLAGARRERVAVVVCDTALRVRRAFVITEGSTDQCLVPIRDILTAVLLHDGTAFAVAHNHPSGETTPSVADEQVTWSLSAAAQATGLDFLGHLVVGPLLWSSCRERPPDHRADHPADHAADRAADEEDSAAARGRPP